MISKYRTREIQIKRSQGSEKTARQWIRFLQWQPRCNALNPFLGVYEKRRRSQTISPWQRSMVIKVTENMNQLNLGVNSVQLPILAEEKNKIWGIEPTCVRSLRQFVAKLGLESWFPNSSS